VKVTGVPVPTVEEGPTVSTREVEGLVTTTTADAVSVGAAPPSTASVPVAVALSVTVRSFVVLSVTTLEQEKVQVAVGSRTELTLLELETKVAEPQNDPVTVTDFKGSDPVLVSL
jgi:hypothetical protein